LIELMIVVVIVGILAAIALPAYQDYMTRSKISELIARLAEAKTSVSEYFASHGSYGSNASSVGLNTSASGKYVSSLACGTNCGELTVTSSSATDLPSDARGKTIILSATSTANGVVTWKCKAGTMPSKYLPGSCKG
ncbi:MAG: pilin, partial [Ferrovibrio sp.]|uniref:pilin n=1 Tax=Ferrovibrio sp. TaxID=1917215 RepID=UPI00391CD367